MAASVQCRQEERSLLLVEKDEDDLSLFLEMRNSDKENNNNLIVHKNSGDFDHDPLESEAENYLTSKIATAAAAAMMHSQKPYVDDFLNSENNGTDYDWLLSPPGTPVLEMEGQKSLTSPNSFSSGHPSAPRSKLASIPTEPTSRTNAASRNQTSSNAVKSSSAGIRKPSPSRRPTSTTVLRPATPTGRPTLPSMTKPSRSSTPTSRPTLTSIKPVVAPKRSSTPTRSSTRSSTPTARPSGVDAPNPKPRSSTPTHRTTLPSSVPSTSANAGRSSSVTKSHAKNPASSRGPSPSAKSRPSKNPPEVSSITSEVPPRSKSSLRERPASASKERPGTLGMKLSSVETNAKGTQKRNPSPPVRRQVSNNGANNNRRTGVARGQGYSINSDDVNPVLMGTKMVERVVNMRKLAPPKQDDQSSERNNGSGKSSSSQDSSGFGRSLSKKSFDMALRHMDIRRSMPGNLRTMMTKLPASSMYSVRSDSSATVGALDSPLATSSNASSSELSVSNKYGYTDTSEVEDNDLGSDNRHFLPC